MNILFVATHLNIGGIGRYVFNLAVALKKRNHNLIVATSGGELLTDIEKSGIKHIYLNIKTKSELSPKIFFATSSLVKIIRENNIQIVHAHTRVTEVASFFASRITKIPFIATGHGFYKKRLGRIFLKCFGDKTVAISEAVRLHLIDDFKLKPSDVKTIYTGIDIEKFSRNFSKEEIDNIKNKYHISGWPLIGVVARLSEEKGHIYLLKAFRDILRKGFPEARLLIIGEGRTKRDLVGYIDDNGISENVLFLGAMADTSAILHVFDIFALPSIKEGLGLALIEAQVAGIPSIATDVGGISDLIKDGETGLLVKAGNKDSLREAVLNLLKDKNFAKTLAENGKNYAMSNFSIDSMAINIEGLYKGAIKSYEP